MFSVTSDPSPIGQFFQPIRLFRDVFFRLYFLRITGVSDLDRKRVSSTTDLLYPSGASLTVNRKQQS